MHEEHATELLERIQVEKAKHLKDGRLKKEQYLPTITEDEIPYDLPNGWIWCRLNEIFNFIDYRGKTPEKTIAGIPLITGTNIKKGYMDYTKKFYISFEEYETRKSRGLSQKGDILFTTEAPLGHVAFADKDEYSTGQRIITMQSFHTELINQLFVYFILSQDFQQRIFEKRSGMTAAGIKFPSLLLPNNLVFLLRLINCLSFVMNWKLKSKN